MREKLRLMLSEFIPPASVNAVTDSILESVRNTGSWPRTVSFNTPESEPFALIFETADGELSGVRLGEASDVDTQSLDIAKETRQRTEWFRLTKSAFHMPEEWLAEVFAVQVRAIRRWESGEYSVPVNVAEGIQALADAIVELVEELSDTLSSQSNPSISLTEPMFISFEDGRVELPEDVRVLVATLVRVELGGLRIR